MDLTLRTEAFQSENQSWLGSAHGTEEADSITLDGATLGAVFASGVVPSGVVLGKITATGLYGPYASGAGDGRQTPVGHLLTTVELFIALRGDAAGVFHNVGGALFWHGEVIIANLPANSGYTGAVLTALPLVRYV